MPTKLAIFKVTVIAHKANTDKECEPIVEDLRAVLETGLLMAQDELNDRFRTAEIEVVLED